MVEDQNPERRTIPIDLLRLASATRAYAQVLTAVLPAVTALGADGAFLRDLMDASLKPTEWGTVAAIQMAVSELIGES